ncbi:MAG: HAD family hydrolase [Geitlerinemataceae cyanobacterium]
MERLQPLDRLTHWHGNIRAIATDMDGTLTRRGEFSSALLADFERLDAAGIAVVVTTGRSAGWVSGLACYLPVAGLMAENGGIFYPGSRLKTLKSALSVEQISDRARDPNGWMLKDLGTLSRHRTTLSQVFYRLCQDFPHLQESSDNPFRQTDWTFDVRGLDDRQIDIIKSLCLGARCGFTYSNVQCHIQPPHQNKASGLDRLLEELAPDFDRDRLITVGDSPNDESLFDVTRFPRSVGVANLAHYRDRLDHLPIALTAAPEGEGFSELVNWLLD